MPQTDEFTDQDFAPEFTDQDFAPSPESPAKAFEGIKLSPFELAKMEPQIGAPPSLTGPANPQEILTAPLAAIQAPGAIFNEAVMEPMSKMAEDWRLRMGIPTQGGFGPQPVTDIPGTGGLSIARAIAPEFTKGVEERSGEILNSLAAPGMAESLPIASLKAIQAGFGAGAVAQIPESIKEAAAARSAKELGSAVTGGAANLGIAAGIASHLLPRTRAEALRTIGEDYASSQPEAAEVHGNVQTQPGEGPGQVSPREGGGGVQSPAQTVAQATQVSLTLSPEEAAYIAAERQSIDVPVEITDQLPGNEPFAGTIATVDRAGGRILINPGEFSAWLKTVPAERRAQAVKSLVGEERIHLAVDDAAAGDYWNTLTSLEKAIELRRYTGYWKLADAQAAGGRVFSDLDLGHEALRFRLQQLARMTPREIAEAGLRDRIGLKSITALGNVVRTIRETLGTKASKEALAILDRVSANLDAAKGAAAGQPAAFRKKKGPVDIFSGHMDLPPMQPGQERADIRGAPNAFQVEGAIGQIFQEHKGFPTLDEVMGPLKRDFGPNVSRESVFHQWQNKLTTDLMNASGEELKSKLRELKLTGDVAEAMQPNIRDPYLGKIGEPQKDIANAFAEEFLTGAFESKKAKRMVSQLRNRPEQQRRMAAIGAILDKLVAEGGGPPKAPSLDRSTIGPEDLIQRYSVTEEAGPEPGEPGAFQLLGGKSDWHTFGLDERTNLQAVADRVLRRGGPRKMGEAVSTSRALVALKDKTSGKISLVSAWKDGRRGPVVENPITGSSRQIDARLLSQFEPMATMMLRDPVRHFRQVFDTQEAFDQHFGDLATGTPGLRTSSFVGPQAGLANVSAGIERAEEFTSEDFAPRKPLGPRTDLIYGRPPAATGARELTTLRTTAPTAIPGQMPPRGAGPTPTLPEPQPPAKLSPEAQQRIEQAALERHPDIGAGTKEMPIPPSTGKITEYGKPKALQPGSIYRMSIDPALRKNAPAAFNKNVAQARDAFRVVEDAINAIYVRGGTKRDIVAGLDAADSANARAAINVSEAIRAESMKDLPTIKTPTGTTTIRTSKIVRDEKAEAKQRREAGIAYIAAAGDLNKLTIGTPAKGARPAQPSFEDQLSYARQRAQMWETDPNPLKRFQGRKDTAYIQKLYEDLQYAKNHWTDPEFVAGAKKYEQELKDEVAWEKANGRDVEEHENYIPGRYEGSYWMDSTLGRRVLGTQFRGRKTFANPYEAIRYGPFRMMSLDLADLAEHRVSQGSRQVEHDIWFRGLRNITDPVTSAPVAVDPVVVKKTHPVTGREHFEYRSPSPEYVMVYPRTSGSPLAVRVGYAPLIEALTSPANILGKTVPFADHIDAVNQMLKHGAILLWDSFHLGRVAQYAQAMMGYRKLAGIEGGVSALRFRPQDLDTAVKKGLISKEAADWAREPIKMGKNLTLTRQQIMLQLMDRGFNASRVVDALYKDAAEHIPGFGPNIYKPYIAPWNGWLFQKFIPGVMIEAAVENAIKMRQANPTVPLSKLLKDVANDTNIMFGNMGRQGIFQTKTFQQLGRVAFLAPMWQEGLFRKEAGLLARTGLAATRAVGMDIPYRRGLPAFGALGEAMGRGIFAYFVGTQLINLATRGKPTWKNPEKEHKMDAWVPTGKNTGFWISPLAVFGEITHDIIRLNQTKRNTWEVIKQMGENRLSPVGKMGSILWTGKSPEGEYYSTTGGVLAGAASQLMPGFGASPITLAPIARAAGHALFPGQIAPNPPGRVARQAVAASTGIKVEPSKNATQEMGIITRRFIKDHGLQKSEGWMQVRTDAPSYDKLRTALRNDDVKGAKYNLQELRKHHTDDQIRMAMNLWAKRPWTGSQINDSSLMQEMSNDEIQTMHEADLERMDVLNKFSEFIRR